MDLEQGEDLEQSERLQLWKPSSRLLLVGLVVAVFTGLVLAKTVQSPRTPTVLPSGSATSVTSVRNDASGDYQAALASGKPIYVLFHSLS